MSAARATVCMFAFTFGATEALAQGYAPYGPPPPGYGQPPPYSAPPPGYARGPYGPPPPPLPSCCTASMRINPLNLIDERASFEVEFALPEHFSFELDGDYIFGLGATEGDRFSGNGYSAGAKLGYWFSSYTALRGWYGKAVVRYTSLRLNTIGSAYKNETRFSELGVGAMLGNQMNFGDSGGGFTFSWGLGVLYTPRARNILFQTGPSTGIVKEHPACAGTLSGDGVCIVRPQFSPIGQLAVGYTF